MKVITLLFLVSLSFPYDRNYLMDSEDLPYEGSFLACRIFRSFYTNCRLTDYDLYLIDKYGRFYNINPLVIATKVEQENNLWRNINDAHPMPYEMRYRRALAFWLWDRNNENYEKQLQLFCIHINLYRKEYKGPGLPFKLDGSHGIVYPVSVATYVLYRYTPFYGLTLNCGFINSGNRNYELIYQEFKPKWKLALKVAEQVSNYYLTEARLKGILSIQIDTGVVETNILQASQSN